MGLGFIGYLGTAGPTIRRFFLFKAFFTLIPVLCAPGYSRDLDGVP